MKYLKKFLLTALTVSSFLSIAQTITNNPIKINIADINKNNKVFFEEDIAAVMPESTPTNPIYPLGLQAQFSLKYKGAFRVNATNSVSNSNYAVGTLAYNPNHHSIFMAGHSHHNAIAEFEIPISLSFEPRAKDIPNAQVLQNYVRALDNIRTNRITGMLYKNDKLLVSSEIWYDGSGGNTDNLQVLNASDLSEKPKGVLKIEGKARAAGYMSKIPENMRSKLNADYLVGWSSVYSITSRYSQGPSLFTFNPNQVLNINPDGNGVINTKAIQVYPLEKGTQLVEGANDYQKNVSPIWGALSRGIYGFIVPNTSTFMVVGSHAGIHSGIGYKIIQQGKTGACSGGCTYKPDDNYSYFWLFNVNEMLTTENPWDVKPFSYGKWRTPFDGRIIGATFDDTNNILYMSISGAARTGEYDRPPMIVAYNVTAK